MDCLKNIQLWAFTSGEDGADSDGNPKIEITAQGETRSVSIPDLPEDDYTKNKGDLFKIHMSMFGFSSGCVYPDEIEEMSIVADGRT